MVLEREFWIAVMKAQAELGLDIPADDIAAMAKLTTDAMSAGALGFSTSRILGHQSIHGDPVPGTFATEAEVFAIGEAMQASGAVFELVPGGSVGQGGMALGSNEPVLDQELKWMERLSIETGLPLTFLIVEFLEDPDVWNDPEFWASPAVTPAMPRAREPAP